MNKTSTWYEGIIENISQSGVLFNGPQQLPVNALIEMVFEMPEEISGQKNSNVVCQGRIMRFKEVKKVEDGQWSWPPPSSTTNSSTRNLESSYSRETTSQHFSAASAAFPRDLAIKSFPTITAASSNLVSHLRVPASSLSCATLCPPCPPSPHCCTPE